MSCQRLIVRYVSFASPSPGDAARHWREKLLVTRRFRRWLADISKLDSRDSAGDYFGVEEISERNSLWTARSYASLSGEGDRQGIVTGRNSL